MKINYIDQLEKSGLNIPDNWEGDVRNRLQRLINPLIEKTAVSTRINTTDRTKKILEIWKVGHSKRVMGVGGVRKDMNLNAFFNRYFYEEVSQKVQLRDNERPEKTQPHLHISLEQFWNIICVATGNLESII